MDADRSSNYSPYPSAQQPGRPSFDQLSQRAHARNASAGYNAASFAAPARQEPLRPGRDEEAAGFVNGDDADAEDEPFDIYADFNNAGPRYAGGDGTAHLPAPDGSSPGFGSGSSKGYRPIRTADSAKSEAGAGGVEMVTVPRFGAEWGAAELRAMTKGGRDDEKREARALRWRRWVRDQHGFCGGWGTRRALVFITFGLAVLAGVLLAICIPRVPAFSFRSTAPFAPVGNNTDPEQYKNAFSRTPANFTFPSWIQLEVDTHANILPVHFRHIEAQVFEANTFKLIAQGELGGTVMKSSLAIPLLFPVVFQYEAVNDTDLTWVNVYEACRNHINDPTGERPGIDVRLIINMDIIGLLKSVATSTQISGVACPIELPVDAV